MGLHETPNTADGTLTCHPAFLTVASQLRVHPVDPHYCVFKCPPRSGPLPPYARIGNSLAVNSGKFR
jgi:hypothetical protein